MRPDFGARAARYDELRPLDEDWWELYGALVRLGDLRGRRVLDIGAGTGAFAAALGEREACRVWGVEPAPEMLETATAKALRGVRFKLGRAEQLPFKDGWFERATMRLVVHLVDRPRAFAEARRVLGADGRLAIATFDPAHFDAYWLNRFFPSLEQIDRSRFPTPEALDRELLEAGFAAVEIRRLSQRAELDREAALAKVRGRHISTFDLIDEAEYAAGLARAERELPPRVQVALEWVCAVATKR